MLSNPEKLLDGVACTNDDKHMWLGPMPAPPTCLELALTYSKQEKLGGVRIWNFNKSLLDSVKGVKECEIQLNDSVMWTGTISRGNGHAMIENCTEIAISENF